MTDARWERWASSTGIGAAIAFLAAFLIQGTPPGMDDDAQTVGNWFADNRSQLLTARFVEALGVILFVWFLGALVTALRDAGQTRLGTTAAIGGTLTLAVGGLGYAIQTGLAQSIVADADAATTLGLYDLSFVTFAITGIAMAVLALATGVAVMRSGVLPNWYAWASIASAIVFFITSCAYASSGFFAPDGAVGAIGYFLFVGWLLVTSGTLVQHQTAAAPRPATAM